MMKKSNTSINLLNFLFLLLLNTSANVSCFSQCTTAGPNPPESSANNTSVGNQAWAGTTMITNSDGLKSVSVALLFGNVTNYLVATDFNFSLPPTAVICGITVQIEKSAGGLFQSVTDNSVRLVKGGGIVGNDKATSTVWPTADNVYSYGGAGDLWGTTWTYADINAVGFGIAFSANLTGSVVLPSAFVDQIQISVSYQDTLPVELLSCSSKRSSSSEIVINWVTATETENDFFTIERSTDGKNWRVFQFVSGAQNSTSVNTYKVYDDTAPTSVVYYRLSQTDLNGASEILAITKVEALDVGEIALYPNPSNGLFHLQSNSSFNEITIYNQTGKVVFYEHCECSPDNTFKTSELFESGNYIVRFSTCDGKIGYKKLMIH